MLLAEDHLWKWWSSTNSIGECISFSFITVFQWEFTRFNHHIMFRLRKFGMMHVSKPYIEESSWKKKLISTESFDSKVVFARWFALFTEGTHQVFSSWGFTRKLASIFCGTRHKTLSYLWAFFEASSLFLDQSANHSLDATRDSDTNVFPGWW